MYSLYQKLISLFVLFFIFTNHPLQARVKNITDEQYVNYLNAKKPFTSMSIAEPGRVIFGDITIQF